MSNEFAPFGIPFLEILPTDKPLTHSKLQQVGTIW